MHSTLVIPLFLLPLTNLLFLPLFSPLPVHPHISFTSPSSFHIFPLPLSNNTLLTLPFLVHSLLTSFSYLFSHLFTHPVICLFTPHVFFLPLFTFVRSLSHCFHITLAIPSFPSLCQTLNRLLLHPCFHPYFFTHTLPSLHPPSSTFSPSPVKHHTTFSTSVFTLTCSPTYFFHLTLVIPYFPTLVMHPTTSYTSVPYHPSLFTHLLAYYLHFTLLTQHISFTPPLHSPAIRSLLFLSYIASFLSFRHRRVALDKNIAFFCHHHLGSPSVPVVPRENPHAV